MQVCCKIGSQTRGKARGTSLGMRCLYSPYLAETERRQAPAKRGGLHEDDGEQERHEHDHENDDAPPAALLLRVAHELAHAAQAVAQLAVRAVDAMLEVRQHPGGAGRMEYVSQADAAAGEGGYTHSLCTLISCPMRLACCAIVCSVPAIESIVVSCARIIICIAALALATRRRAIKFKSQNGRNRAHLLLGLCPGRLVVVPVALCEG